MRTLPVRVRASSSWRTNVTRPVARLVRVRTEGDGGGRADFHRAKLRLGHVGDHPHVAQIGDAEQFVARLRHLPFDGGLGQHEAAEIGDGQSNVITG